MQSIVKTGDIVKTNINEEKQIYSIETIQNVVPSCNENIFVRSNYLFFNIYEYQKYYDNGYGVNEYHAYRNAWSIMPRIIDNNWHGRFKTCKYSNYNAILNADILPKIMPVTKFDVLEKTDKYIDANVKYEIYKNFYANVSDILYCKDDNSYLFSSIKPEEYYQLVHKLETTGIDEPIVCVYAKNNFYPLQTSTIFTIAMLLKIPSIPIRFLREDTSYDLEEDYDCDMRNIMLRNYNISIKKDVIYDI